MAVFLQELFVQAAAVDPDPDGNVLALAHLHHRLHPVFPANVAGVDADLRRAAFRCGNLPEAPGRLLIGHRQAGNLAAGGLQRLQLPEASLHICGLGVEHRLDGHWRATAHRNVSHLNLSDHSTAHLKQKSE